MELAHLNTSSRLQRDTRTYETMKQDCTLVETCHERLHLAVSTLSLPFQRLVEFVLSHLVDFSGLSPSNLNLG